MRKSTETIWKKTKLWEITSIKKQIKSEFSYECFKYFWYRSEEEEEEHKNRSVYLYKIQYSGLLPGRILHLKCHCCYLVIQVCHAVVIYLYILWNRCGLPACQTDKEFIYLQVADDAEWFGSAQSAGGGGWQLVGSAYQKVPCCWVTATLCAHVTELREADIIWGPALLSAG